jgi:hypothetical protein
MFFIPLEEPYLRFRVICAEDGTESRQSPIKVMRRNARLALFS